MVSVGCGSSPLDADTLPDETVTAKQTLAAVNVNVPEAVAAGAYHSLMLRKTGTVWSWGQNQYGQLGTSGVPTVVTTPTPVASLPAVKAIATGIGHSLALDLDGQVWAWGQNASGQVGLGSAVGTVPMPTKLVGLTGIQRIAAGGNYSLALDSAGQVWAWGQNTSGQVGTGTSSVSVPSPVRVTGLPAIRAIAAGLNHVLALDTSGGVWAWGQNTFGQVGTGATSTTVLLPTRVVGLPRARAIAAGAGHSLVIEELSGNAWAWGQNNFGQVGGGGIGTTPILAPAPVSGVSAATSIVAGHYFSLAVMDNGRVKTWGQNTSGQLGNGTTENSAVSLEVAGLGDATAIAAGAQHALTLRPGCPVWAWGNNGQGQLGTGNTSNSTTMVQSLLFNTFHFDGDGDGFGDQYVTEAACTPSPGFVEEVDCDDYTPSTHPGAAEMCNGVDDNCNGAVDDGNPGGNLGCWTGKPGVCSMGTTVCTNGGVQCAQNTAASAERCDGLDNDCDGESDEDNPEGMKDCSTGELGVCGAGVTYCTGGTLHCVQTEAAASEVCDGLDNDCDGQVDESLPVQTWYRDADGDGYGSPTVIAVQNCRKPAGYSGNNLDCNDASSAIRPWATEVCDGKDNDCDGQVDENVKITYYRDADADTYGVTASKVLACSKPAGYATRGGDCNDASSAIKPGATEVCDGKDNDCDGTTDEGLKKTYYRDVDADTYGVSSVTTTACSMPGGYATRGGDCNDSSSSINPGASDVCWMDRNCDGVAPYCEENDPGD
jgi:alpha-tubulin suppressor-like RCC1 family protein